MPGKKKNKLWFQIRRKVIVFLIRLFFKRKAFILFGQDPPVAGDSITVNGMTAVFKDKEIRH